MANPREFYIEIWNPQDTEEIVKIKAFSSLWYEDTIDKGKQAEITIPYTRTEITRENISVMNRVKIYQAEELKWDGFIDRWSFRRDVVTINLTGLNGILEKRIVDDNYDAQSATAIFEDVIDDMNLEDETGISVGVVQYAGDGTVATANATTNVFTSASHGLSNDDTIVLINTGGSLPTPLEEQAVYFVVNVAGDDFQLSFTQGGSAIDITDAGTGTTGFIPADRAFTFANQTVSAAMKSIASSIGSEFFIDNGGIAKILVARGEDKTESVAFKMLDDRPNENNIQDIDVILDGSKLYNKVTGTATTLTSVQENAASQAAYGLLEQNVAFGDVSNQPTLDGETSRYVDTYDMPIEIPKIRPLTEEIDESLYDVGDNVRVHLKRGFYELDEPFRIVSKRVTVRGDKQQVDAEVGLSDTPQSRADVLIEIAGTARRVYNLEQRVSNLENP